MSRCKGEVVPDFQQRIMARFRGLLASYRASNKARPEGLAFDDRVLWPSISREQFMAEGARLLRAKWSSVVPLRNGPYQRRRIVRRELP
jgi:hypothetical protein